MTTYDRRASKVQLWTTDGLDAGSTVCLHVASAPVLVGAEVTHRAMAALPARRTSLDQCKQLATAARAAAAVASAFRASACCSSSDSASAGTSAASGSGSLASIATASSGEADPAPEDHACVTWPRR